MNQHTLAAKDWLDRRYSRNSQGAYRAHQPIYGLATESAEPNAVLRFARTYRLLARLHTLEFDSVLDVGGGEGYLAALVRDLFGSGVVHASDLSTEACRRAGEIFGIQGAAADATRLPFADDSYDLVICSEVIEHLSRPAAAIAELCRIARSFVVISTAEFCPAGELERHLRKLTLDSSYPHAEMNWFTAGDFRALLGDRIVLGSQYRNLEYLLPNVEWTRDRVERALALLTASDGIDVDHAGVIVISPRGRAAATPAPAPIDATRRRQILDRLLEPHLPRGETAHTTARPLDDSMRARLQCVRCRSAVSVDAGETRLTCDACHHAYELVAGVPAMFAGTEDDRHSRDADDEAVAVLAGGDSGREPSVRLVMERLHSSDSRQNPAWRQKVASQLLRVLWLGCRAEPLPRKLTRLVGQVMGRPPVGSREVHAALFASDAGRDAPQTTSHDVSVKA